MKLAKQILLLSISILSVSCNQMSEEDLLVHNQKVIAGIDKKTATLDKVLENIDTQLKLLLKEYDRVNSFKLFRSSKKRQRQLSDINNKATSLKAYKKRTEKLKSQLSLLHKTFDWQSSPTQVLEKVFEIAKKQTYGEAIFLGDPYGENDADVDGISFVACHPKEVKDQFINTFKNGRIIGEPIVNETQAKIEFLFGPRADKKETMVFVKRKDSWYLSSF